MVPVPNTVPVAKPVANPASVGSPVGYGALVEQSLSNRPGLCGRRALSSSWPCLVLSSTLSLGKARAEARAKQAVAAVRMLFPTMLESVSRSGRNKRQLRSERRETNKLKRAWMGVSA